MEVNIGGDRLGSGNKLTTELNHYSRSTHDLGFIWQSSLAPGVLYPFMCIPALNGDTFDIDLNALCRTIPTQGPLFGSFKLQMDVFQVPMRLYNGILHNNPISLGLNMNKVFFPKVLIKHNVLADCDYTKEDYGNETTNGSQFSPSSLIKYLGLSGIGSSFDPEDDPVIERKVNAVPMLAYYDIFKNYYANKQEDSAFVITPTPTSSHVPVNGIVCMRASVVTDSFVNKSSGFSWQLGNQAIDRVVVSLPSKYATDAIKVVKFGTLTAYDVLEKETLSSGTLRMVFGNADGSLIPANSKLTLLTPTLTTKSDIFITEFPLSNIDDMREFLLSRGSLGSEVVCGRDINIMPYKTISDVRSIQDSEGTPIDASANCFTMNGLCLKTYQSDMFNSFINRTWIDGSNGINELTKIDVSSGSLAMDALNLQQKLYNVLNRIAVCGGTYEDWQTAVYTTNVPRKAETPIYCGGLSKEIVFEEVVSTNSGDNSDALGTLGGRGTLGSKHKGGKVVIHVNEPSFIMAMVSITPRISYNQGNAWYMTELNSFDDLHKPALDGIGFEDLIGERMAWWNTQLESNGSMHRSSYGKLPAWINYQTNFDQTFGDFALENDKAYMCLNRGYERDGGSIDDATTYIDPRKYNYAFAYSELGAQNFWLSIKSDVIARRIMSAKVIPNL